MNKWDKVFVSCILGAFFCGVMAVKAAWTPSNMDRQPATNVGALMYGYDSSGQTGRPLAVDGSGLLKGVGSFNGSVLQYPYSASVVSANFSASVSTTTPVTFITATASTYKDCDICVSNGASSAVSFSLSEGASVILPTAFQIAPQMTYCKTFKGTQANANWILTLTNAVTAVGIGGQSHSRTQ